MRKVHRILRNHGRWVVPITYGHLRETPVATAHRMFVRQGLDGDMIYSRPCFWKHPDGTPRFKAKWQEYLTALRANPFVIVTDDEWTLRKNGLYSPSRTGYVALFRLDNLILSERSGQNMWLTERISIQTQSRESHAG